MTDYGIDGQKLDLHIDRVYEWKYRGETAPIYVEISPTALCNHACTFCALDYANHANITIPRQKLLDLGPQLSQLGVRGVMFGGEGEPTLHPDLPEVIGAYHDEEIDCALTTNGAKLSADFAKEGGEFQKWVKVSMNGGTPEAYEAIHKVNAFESTWEKLAEFRKACRHGHPTIGVQAVILQDNLSSLPALCKRAADEKLDYVVLKPFSPNSYSPNSKNVKLPSEEEVALTLQECRMAQTAKTRIVTRDCAISSLASKTRYARCLSVPFFWAYINSHAEVIACSNHMKDARFNLGSLYTHRLLDIWYSYSNTKREELKKVMRNFDCKECRKACRMDRVNEWLWRIANPGEHRSFI